MGDYHTLIGAEDVRSAGHTMARAAETMSSAASTTSSASDSVKSAADTLGQAALVMSDSADGIEHSLHRHRMFLDEWLGRLETMVDKLSVVLGEAK